MANLRCFLWKTTVLVFACMLGMSGAYAESGDGEVLLRRMAAANAYWLTAPPDSVRNYSYTHGRGSDTRHFEVENPRTVPADVRWGITYRTGLHALARDPESAVIVDVAEDGGNVRIDFRFDKQVGGACGNGLAGSWYGYCNLGVTTGSLWIDPERAVPLELRCGILTERFEQYVKVDEGHYVPLNIKVDKANDEEGMHFDWLFRVYEPGLWLLDAARYTCGDGRPVPVAMVTDVVVNGKGAQAANAPEEAVGVLAESEEGQAQREAQARGRQHAEAMIAANRLWLLPPLDARRGLAYDYRQEGSYRERVWFDGEGRILVQLAGTKEGPESPSRQYLFLPEGVKVVADVGQDYVSELEVKGVNGFEGAEPLHRDRNVQNLAVGLGWDCALTRLARDPGAFLLEVEPAADGGTYKLILTPTVETSLFTGTMLTFTSWAYMHDVEYTRSEITCDAKTHRPIEERDFNGDGKLVGSYTFSDYIESGGAPGRIVASIPYEKDGKDNSLDMTATFRFAKPDVWLLDNVRSVFRGGEGESTGTVTLNAASSSELEPLRNALQRLEATRALRDALAAAPEGPQVAPFAVGEPIPLWAAGQWKFEHEEEEKIAVREVRIEPADAGKLAVTADVVSNVYWKEFEVVLAVELLDAEGRRVGGGEIKAPVRTEGVLSHTPVVIEAVEADVAKVKTVSVRLSVERLSAAHHGHGMWYYFMDVRE